MEIEYVELERMDNKDRLVKYYDRLTRQEKEQILKQLKQERVKLEARIKEKQSIIDYLESHFITEVH